MINKDKNKRVQLTLPHETAELLQSLSIRYNKSSSEVVKWALNVLASKKKHIFTIKYNECEESTNEVKETLKKIVKLQNDNDNMSWDEMLDDIDEANLKH